MSFVLDASVTLSWLFEDEQTAYTESILDYLYNSSAVVPTIWPLEIGNSMVVGERRGRVSIARGEQFLRQLGDLPISVESVDLNRLFSSLLNIAREHQLSVYDASYLELALRDGIPLASKDTRLCRGAQALGVPLVVEV
ncbi:MAG: type II toxin-antitoxin system VapC family toxin [Candidatus Dormibacteraceae bacterium]